MANISTILDPKVRTRALAKIGYFDDTKKRGRQTDYPRLLAWFVKFAGMNLANLSPAELQLLREEIRALQEERFDFTENDASTAQHVSRAHATVSQYLEQLTKTGRIESEEFKLRTSILLPRFSPRPTSPFKHNLYIGEHVEPFDGKGLLYLFFEALKGAGDRLRICPHCSARCVQTIRKQRFCGRACQQVASMRALRDKRMKEREAGKLKKTPRAATAPAVLKHKITPTRDPKTRRRASDGKKRR